MMCAAAFCVAFLSLTAAMPAAELPDVANLVNQLGSARFADRQAAARALEELGPTALDEIRRAAADGDPDVRRQCEDLIRRLELKAASSRLLAPKRVRLSYQNVSLADALVDFTKQTGFVLKLEGEIRPSEKKISLDTGDVTTWEAFDRFCKAAGLVELSLVTPPNVSAPKMSREEEKETLVRLLREQEQQGTVGSRTPIVVVAGKSHTVPTCYAGALRLRVPPPPPSPGWGRTPEAEEVRCALEVSPAAGLAWLGLLDVRIKSALDDQGQELAQVPGLVPSYSFTDRLLRSESPPAGPAVDSRRDLCLRLGKKPTQNLRQMEGVVVGRVRTPPEPAAVVENILTAKGGVVRGPDGYALSATAETGDDSLNVFQVHLEAPLLQSGFVVPRRGDAASPLDESLRNLRLEDARGQPLKYEMGQVSDLRIDNKNRTVSGSITLYHEPKAKQGAPARLVLLGNREAIVEVPFSLTNVPLP